MNKVINLKQALQIIETKDVDGSPVPFDISFRTLNRNAKTGGALRFYNGVSILTNGNRKTAKGLDVSLNNKLLIDSMQTEVKSVKNPNHWKNRTRNLQKTNGEIFKVNIRLIDSINNQKVVY